MTKRILGFDISSSCIGYGLLELDEKTNNIKVIKISYINPIKTGTMVERIINTRNIIRNIINDAKPDDIAIEELVKYMPKSTATTVVVLATFNMMVCLEAYDYLKRTPNIYNVLTIRHGLKISSFPKKEEMPELVAKHLGITFPYEYKKKGALKVENYDAADGTAVALYHTFILANKINKKVKKK